MALCDEQTQREFHAFMLDRPRVWEVETGLKNWSRFIQLVRNRRGIEAARILLHREGLSEGFQRLMDARRPDLTVEWAILHPPYDCCFTAEERRLARVKLVSNGIPRADLPPEPDCPKGS